ncbi:MAG: thioredoxin [Bacteroidales bacterium]|nr:thioredoxin [Bacteroidales bacterium]
MVVEVIESSFDSLLQGAQPVIVDFGATWCGPCKALAPIIEELANEYEGKAVFAKADVEECSELAARFRIRNVPTVLFFKGGEMKDKSVGLVAKATLAEKVNALL